MTPTNKITQQQHDAIERAVIKAANATSKSAATRYLNQARNIRATLEGVIDYYSDDELGSAISMADEAFKNRTDERKRLMYLQNAKTYLHTYKGHLTIE
ncbi:TPA: hypothetical protein ACPYV0_003039 [Citrobacter amalonaticus]